MLGLEDYIAKRKKEDKLNEFDFSSKAENMRICVNYVFEYFNQYLDDSKMDEKTVLHEEKLEKFRHGQLRNYEPEIQEWLVDIFNHYDKQLNKSIVSFLKKDELFLLYHTDQEFRALSYDCYAHLIKKHPFLKDQTEMLFQFIKDHHRIKSLPQDNISPMYITAEINEWIEKTWNKYQVNLWEFASDYLCLFDDNNSVWDSKHRIKSDNSWRKFEYDYKQKSNLFNINVLYKKINKPFLRGKKQYLEILFMHTWLHGITSDEDYWEEYINKVLPRNMNI